MLEAAELRRNGIAPFVVVHAENIHADAAAEVDVLPPVRAAEERALAADDLQRKTVIGVGKILLIECLRKHNWPPVGPLGSVLRLLYSLVCILVNPGHGKKSLWLFPMPGAKIAKRILWHRFCNFGRCGG